MGEHRVVTEYEIKDYCRQQGEMVKSLEVSMLNGYGLKSVVCFFNIPFLYMQVLLPLFSLSLSFSFSFSFSLVLMNGAEAIHSTTIGQKHGRD